MLNSQGTLDGQVVQSIVDASLAFSLDSYTDSLYVNRFVD